MGKSRDRLAAAILALLLLALPDSLFARERRGAIIVIALKDGQTVAGELIAVKPDSLLLFGGKDESVDLASITRIRIVRKSKALLGAGCGWLAGVLVTVIYAKIMVPDDEAAGLSGLLFVPGGIGTGLLLGAHAGKDKTIQLEGKSESEVTRALAYLRGKARIRDYK